MKKRKNVKRTVRKKKEKTFRKLRKKIVFIVIDGLADLPLNHKTPLTAARKPNLDFLAKNGIVGEIIPVERRLWSDLTKASVSHIANIGLLGFDPKKYYLKRGPIETVGANIPYKDGWLALRCNFCTVDNELKLLDRRVGRNSTGLDEIARYVNQNVKIGVEHIFMRTFEHRAVLILKEELSDKITNSDPYFAWLKVNRVEALTPEANRSAQLVQEFIDKARQVIEFHPANEQRIKSGIPPANYIVTREAGNKLPTIPCFTRKHKIKKAVCIAENGVMKGTCMLTGFDAISVPELKLEQTLNFIFSNIFNSLAEYDFVYAHIKGPDEPAHDGDFHRKQVMIEKIDEYLDEFKNFKGILILTCDHITSCKTRKHEYGPVPILIYGKGKDKVERFDEFSVKKGRLKLIDGKRLWKFILGK
jgi:2,3-bisphosphoglycerate-independent phosphoglycerate mutase